MKGACIYSSGLLGRSNNLYFAATDDANVNVCTYKTPHSNVTLSLRPHQVMSDDFFRNKEKSCT